MVKLTKKEKALIRSSLKAIDNSLWDELKLTRTRLSVYLSKLDDEVIVRYDTRYLTYDSDFHLLKPLEDYSLEALGIDLKKLWQL